MNTVLTTDAFWELYYNLSSETQTEDDVSTQLEELSKDFVVRKDTFQYEYEGEQRTASSKVVEFPFSCGTKFSMMIEYVPDIFGCDINLFLISADTQFKNQMGWWDLARWHPYCLRPEELDCLLAYWARWDDRWANNSV